MGKRKVEPARKDQEVWMQAFNVACSVDGGDGLKGNVPSGERLTDNGSCRNKKGVAQPGLERSAMAMTMVFSSASAYPGRGRLVKKKAAVKTETVRKRLSIRQ